MPERDDLDRLIDSALTTYADAGSGIDLEARILAKIEREHRWKRMRRPLLWTGTLALAASVLLLVVNTRGPHTSRTAHMQQPLTAKASAAFEKPAPHSTKPTRPYRVDAMVRPQRTKPSGPPKLPVFPTPEPLNAEETALVHLAIKTNSAERKEIQDTQAKSAEPLHIASISIPPIEPPTEGKE